MLLHILLISLAMLILAGPTLVAGQQRLSFHNQYSYVDETKILRVLGEVRNDSGEEVGEIVVGASFVDSDGLNLGQFNRTAEYHSLRPGESSPFEILFLNQEATGKVANYSLSATALPSTENKVLQLKIISSNSRLDLLGTFYLNAVARNDGDETATNTLMIATLYDKDDRVIAIGRALAEAVRGTADVPAGSQAPFGVVITDKLQTSKGVKYSLVVQSDQYASESVLFRTSGPGQTSTGNNQTQSGCLIATAAFGSEFAPQVQELREFRDGLVMQTVAGSSFMNAFNLWYYSFSPAVADYERGSSWARDAIRIAVQPLLAILGLSTTLHNILSSAETNKELAIVATGVTASSLIGSVYLLPVSVVIGIKKRQVLSERPKLIIITCWAASASLIIAGASAGSVESMTVGTSILVICGMSTAVLLISDAISRLRISLSYQSR